MRLGSKSLMSRATRLPIGLLLLGGAVCCVTIAAAVLPLTSPAQAGGRHSTAVELLPDLDPLEPRRVAIVSADGRWAIAFGAATDNLGTGPTIIQGTRTDPDPVSPMQVSQIVRRSDGTSTTYRNVGRLVYVDNSYHQHWHLLGFMTYELRDVATYRLVRPSQKTGFCLMDDYRSDGYNPKHRPPGTPAKAVYTDRCAYGHPDALQVDEGVSVGWGDYYNPILEGQSIDLTGVPEGRYYLVVRANQSKQMHESNYKNNGASVQLALSYPAGTGGKPSMKILSTCRDGDHCLQPVELRVAAPSQVARTVRSFTVRTVVSEPSLVDIRVKIGARVLSHLRKQEPVGSASFVVSVPSEVSRPSSAMVAVRATGPGLLPTLKTLTVQLH